MNTPQKYSTEIYQDNTNNYHWKIIDRFGSIMFSNYQPEKSKMVCEEQIKKVFTLNNDLLAFYYVDEHGKHRCKLINSRDVAIAVSDSFDVKTYCQNTTSNFFHSIVRQQYNNNH